MTLLLGGGERGRGDVLTGGVADEWCHGGMAEERRWFIKLDLDMMLKLNFLQKFFPNEC